MAAWAEVVAEITLTVNKAAAAKEVEQAVAGAKPVTAPAVDEAKTGKAVEESVSRASPVIAPAVDEGKTGKAVSSAVEKAPPTAVPINTAETGKSVEKGMRSADAAGAGKEAGGKFSGAFTGPMTALKGLVMGAIGAEAIIGGQQLFTSLIKQGGDAAKATKVVTDAIKTTGGAAGVTAGEIEKMAGSQSRNTGVSKAAIEQADALLLRFRNVRNEAGAGNDVFNRTSQAALDMTAALNKGTVTAEGLANTTRLLGKAMEDPAKAAGVLRRSGVDLSAQQQEQIKTLLKNNDTLGAQKVVLDAVNKSYGGTAAATASGTAKMHAAVEELEASVGKALLPLLSDTVKVLTQILDVLSPMVEWFTSSSVAAKVLRDTLGALIAITAIWVGSLKAVALYTELSAKATAVYTTVTKAWAVASKEAAAGTSIWRAAQMGLNAAFAANPIGLTVIAIAALTVGIIELYKHSQLFRDLVKETGEIIRTGFLLYLRLLRAEFDLVRKALAALVQFWRGGFDTMVSVTRSGVAAVLAVFRAVAGALTGIWKAEFDLLVAVVRTALGAIVAAIRVFIDLITGVFRVGMDLIHGNWRKAWTDMGGTARQIGGAIGGYIRDLGPLWAGAVGQAGNAMSGVWHRAWEAMTATTRAGGQAVTASIHGLEDVVRGIPGVFDAAGRGVERAIGIMRSAITALPRAVAAAVDLVVAAMERMKQAVAGSADFISGKLGAIGGAAGKVAGLVGKIPGLSAGGQVGAAVAAVQAGFAAGGRITQGTGPVADDVLIRVSRNETVLSAFHSRILAPVLAQVGVPGYRDGGIPAFAGGGIIGKAEDAISGVMHWTAGQVDAAARRVLDLTSKALDMANKALTQVSQHQEQVGHAFGDLAGLLARTASTASGVISSYGAQLGGGKSYGAGGVITEPVVGRGVRSGARYTFGERGRELVIPGYQAGGRVGGGFTLPDLGSLLGRQVTLTLPTKADLTAMVAQTQAGNAGLAAQLARIGETLQANPQAIAAAIAQALNGVARLATAGAAYGTR